MGDITNDFSWSKSRHEKFKECRRAYYLHYYKYWEGWKKDAPEWKRELYRLKKLGNRFTWAGSVVHDAIRDILLDVRAGRPPAPEAALERARGLMRMDFKHSRSLRYRSEKGRKNFFGLVEHEYSEPVSADDWKRSWDAVEQALRWFLQSRWLALAKTLEPKQWLEVDEGFENSNFQKDGVKVFAIPDFAYLDESGIPVVVDWKTGKARDGYDAQLLGYAVYLAARYRFPVETIQTVLVYLNEGTEQTVKVSLESLAEFERHFQESVRGMRALLSTPEQNVPHPEEAFPQNEDRAVCRRCVFRRPCGRDELA